MSSYDGLAVARVALDAAGPRGLPVRTLIDIVTHVGGVSSSSAYVALRAAISPRGQYRSEGGSRWVRRITVHGARLDSQVWIMAPPEPTVTHGPAPATSAPGGT